MLMYHHSNRLGLLGTCSKLLPRTLALILGLAGLASFSGAAAAERLVAQPSSRLTQWTINYDGQPVMIYEFDPQKFKPFIKVLNTLSGYGVLRDSPSDHLHHHALMYGIKVNGVNFWEETAGCGVQKVVETFPPEILKNATGIPQARLVQVLYWLAPEDAFLPNSNSPPLLIERRTLTLTLDPKRRETALHWKSAFAVGTKTNTVTLTGANYHGLGMRFLQELDPLAVHFTPEGKPDLTGNKQDVTTHAWEALAFDAPGKPATLALFGAPGNARGNSHYFAMKTPFAYLSATQGLDQEPLIYRQGDHFELNYLVALYPELKSTEALAERGRGWATGTR
jgi:hypothetical protein